MAKGAGRVSVTEAAREDDGKWWRPPATGDEASEQTLSTMLKLIPRDNACLSSFSLYLFLFLSHLTRYRVFLLSTLARYTYRYPLVFDSSATSYFTLIAGLSPVAFLCLISWYLTQRSCKLLQRTERVVVLLNAGISVLLYRHLPLA